MARIALLAPNQALWYASRSSRVMLAIDSGVPGVGPAVRMEAVDEPVEHHPGDVVRIVVADLEARQNLLTLPLELLGRELRVPRQIGHHVEPEREAVLHHDAR